MRGDEAGGREFTRMTRGSVREIGFRCGCPGRRVAEAGPVLRSPGRETSVDLQTRPRLPRGIQNGFRAAGHPSEQRAQRQGEGEA